MLSAPAIVVDPSVASWWQLKTIHFLGSVLPKLPLVARGETTVNCRDTLVLAQESADPLVFHEPARARWGSEFLKAMMEIEGSLHSITFPFLVCHGSEDQVVQLEGSKKLFAEAASTDKEFKVMHLY